MSEDRSRGVQSNVSLLGHPIHPMLIPFPIALLVGALVTDLVYWFSQDSFWILASFWLLVGGMATGVLAGIVGVVDFLTIDRVRQHIDGWVHAGGNVIVIILAVVNLLLRLGNPLLGSELLLAGTLLSALTSALLVVTSWYGGELVYRHMIAVFGHGQGPTAGKQD